MKIKSLTNVNRMVRLSAYFFNQTHRCRLNYYGYSHPRVNLFGKGAFDARVIKNYNYGQLAKSGDTKVNLSDITREEGDEYLRKRLSDANWKIPLFGGADVVCNFESEPGFYYVIYKTAECDKVVANANFRGLFSFKQVVVEEHTAESPYFRLDFKTNGIKLLDNLEISVIDQASIKSTCLSTCHLFLDIKALAELSDSDACSIIDIIAQCQYDLCKYHDEGFNHCSSPGSNKVWMYLNSCVEDTIILETLHFIKSVSIKAYTRIMNGVYPRFREDIGCFIADYTKDKINRESSAYSFLDDIKRAVYLIFNGSENYDRRYEHERQIMTFMNHLSSGYINGIAMALAMGDPANRFNLFRDFLEMMPADKVFGLVGMFEK